MGDNTGGGTVMLWPIIVNIFEYEFQHLIPSKLQGITSWTLIVCGTQTANSAVKTWDTFVAGRTAGL
jgi:hypothetical protein